MGAEALLGQGDMLYLPPGTGLPQRVHGAFVADHEVHKVVEYLKKLGRARVRRGRARRRREDGEPRRANGEGEAAARPIRSTTRRWRSCCARAAPSISLVQRHLRIGYNRAARLIEQMEQRGLVSAMQSNGNREVLVPEPGGGLGAAAAASLALLLAPLRWRARADALRRASHQFMRDTRSARGEFEQKVYRPRAASWCRSRAARLRSSGRDVPLEPTPSPTSS